MNIEHLEFDEATHTYKYAGETVPGVTSVLDRYSGLEFANAEAVRIAGEFGKHVHDACHLYNHNRLDESSLHPHVADYFRGWSNFMEDSSAVVIMSEQLVYHRTYKYAGRLDTVLQMEYRIRRKSVDVEAVVDIKTSQSVPKTVGWQVAAYELALRDMELDAYDRQPMRRKRYCVHLNPAHERGYKLVDLDRAGDYNLFTAALAVHRGLS